MGCDIHGVWQRRDATTEQWVDVASDYDQGRHYALFAALANVRNGQDIEPISEPRGLPSDFPMDDEAHPIDTLDVMDAGRRAWQTPSDRMEIWMGDHSHSWLSGAEMLEWYEKAPGDQQNTLAYFFEEVRSLTTQHGEIRFVFGFDS